MSVCRQPGPPRLCPPQPIENDLHSFGGSPGAERSAVSDTSLSAEAHPSVGALLTSALDGSVPGGKGAVNPQRRRAELFGPGGQGGGIAPTRPGVVLQPHFPKREGS